MGLCQSFTLPIGNYTEWGRSGWMDYLAWVGLVPLCLLLRASDARRAWWFGFVAGLAYFATVLYWLDWVMNAFAHIPHIGAIPIMLLLVAFLALFWGLAGYTSVGLARGLNLDWCLLFPIVWVALEFLRNYVLTGFPWANIGYTQVRSLWLAQLASLGGVYLVAFAVIWTNTSLSRLLYCLRLKRALPVGSLGVWLGFMVIAGLWGSVRLLSEVGQSQRQLVAAVIQGNLDEKAGLRGPYDQQWVLDRMGKLSRAAQGADLIVWPEGTLPQSIRHEAPSLAKRANTWPAALRATMVIGASGRGVRQGRLFQTNSAFVTDGRLGRIGRYDKRHLVPFGEYIPLSWLLPYEWFVPEGVTFFSPGASHDPIPTPAGALGMLICYEAIFPEIARQTVSLGAEVLVNITNDSWFGPTSSPCQHLSMSIMRSIETDRFQIRAANTGISALVDPRGRELARSALGFAESSTIPVSKECLVTGQVLMSSVQLRQSQTVYVWLGDWFAWICCLVSLSSLVWIVYRHRLRPLTKKWTSP